MCRTIHLRSLGFPIPTKRWMGMNREIITNGRMVGLFDKDNQTVMPRDASKEEAHTEVTSNVRLADWVCRLPMNQRNVRVHLDRAIRARDA